MKSLSDYVQKNQSEIFKNFGVFFAFSNKQYSERAVEGVEYVNTSGCFIPRNNFKKYYDAMEKCQKDGIDQDIKENGKFAIIRRELFNYECFYTYEIQDAIDNLEQYGYNDTDIMEVFNNVRENENVDD